MKDVCCVLYPACYCRDLPPDDYQDPRIRALRHAVPRDDHAGDHQLQIELESRAQARRQRNALIWLVASVLVVLTVALVLAGCGPDDGVIKSPAPEPTTTEMFTVIRPPVGHLAGGIYDNN